MGLRGIAAFAARRILAGIPVVIGITVIVFLFVQLAPGDPEQSIAGPKASPAQLAHVRAEYGLDDPLPSQYWSFLKRAVRFDFGESFSRHQDVTSAVGGALGVTVPLLFVSFLLIALLGVSLGTLAAYHAGGLIDRIVIGVAVVAASAPAFVLAILLSDLFGVQLRWLPTFGEGEGFTDSVEHLILPIATVTLGGLAAMLQVTRTRVREVRREDYVTFAEARGLPRSYVLTRAVLRNSAVQLITQGGSILIALLAVIVLTEEAFGLIGVGSLLLHAIHALDVPMIQGITLITTVFVLLVNLVVDILYFVIDPRTQVKQSRSGAIA